MIKAKAKLNGAPADIDMVEPIGENGLKRSRSIEVVLDDEAREELAPGIAMLVQGPVSVKFVSGDGDSRQIEADLTDATLDIPWVGWSKGPGIAANATFTLTSGEKSSKLDNFKLRGKSFAIDGDITLSNGSLSSARLSSVKLNRDDDASVTIDRKGKGFNDQRDRQLARRPRDRQIAEGRSRRGAGGQRQRLDLDRRKAWPAYRLP